MAGDLVCRGPDPLGVLRWARALDRHIVAVLGNHDLRLLAIAAGHKRARPNDQLHALLAAPDRDGLLAWLRQRPLMHAELNTAGVPARALLHAGLVPQWDIQTALGLAREAQEALRGPQHLQLLANLSAPVAPLWQPQLAGTARLLFTIKVLTYLRVCASTGAPHFDFTGAPADAPAGQLPWFAVPTRQTRGTPLVCGHWSALGLHRGDNVDAIDSGCVWGHSLTALRLEDGVYFSAPTAAGDRALAAAAN